MGLVGRECGNGGSAFGGEGLVRIVVCLVGRKW